MRRFWIPRRRCGPEALRGKIALIGVTLADGGDRHRVIRGWKREQTFGVELHADTIANLERGVAVRPLGPTAQLLLMLALAVAGAAASFLLFDRAARHRGIALGLALVAYACAGVALYVAFDILLNMLYDVAAFAAARCGAGASAKEGTCRDDRGGLAMRARSMHRDLVASPRSVPRQALRSRTCRRSAATAAGGEAPPPWLVMVARVDPADPARYVGIAATIFPRPHLPVGAPPRKRPAVPSAARR